MLWVWVLSQNTMAWQWHSAGLVAMIGEVLLLLLEWMLCGWVLSLCPLLSWMQSEGLVVTMMDEALSSTWQAHQLLQ